MGRIDHGIAAGLTALLLTTMVAVPALGAEAITDDDAVQAGQRVERSRLGIALTWPEGWYVENERPYRLKDEPGSPAPVSLIEPGDVAWAGVAGARLRGKRANGECTVHLYESSSLTLDAIVDWYTDLEPRVEDAQFEVTEVERRDDLTAGEAATFVLDATWFGTQPAYVASNIFYWIDGGDAIAMLRCVGHWPADRMSAAADAIAPTIEFLSDEPVLATYVTGKVLGRTDRDVDHPLYTIERQVKWNDPRLPSDMLSHLHMSLIPSADPMSTWAQTVRLEGPDGVWVGTSRGYAAAGGPPREVIALTGEGAYEGLSAMIGWKRVKEGRKPRLEGYIYEFPLLGMPEPVAPGAE